MNPSTEAIRSEAVTKASPISDNLLTFRMDRQHYALPIEPIVRVIEMVTIVPLPQIAPAVAGIINVNGSLIPVVDLRRHLRLPPIPWTLHTPIILLHLKDQVIGMIVDEVLDILKPAADAVISPQTILPSEIRRVDLLQGLLNHQGRMLLILDCTRLFDPQQIRSLAETAAALQENTDE